MGLIGMPSNNHYWKTDPLFRNQFLASVMGRAKFEAIMRFLHFGEHPLFPDDRLGKGKVTY